MAEQKKQAPSKPAPAPKKKAPTPLEAIDEQLAANRKQLKELKSKGGDPYKQALIRRRWLIEQRDLLKE